jgi:argininosuccinate synthase
LVFTGTRGLARTLHRNTTRRVNSFGLILYIGNIIVAGRKSPKSLYDPKIATMEGEKSGYDEGDATGSIRLNALRLKLRAAMQGRGD